MSVTELGCTRDPEGPTTLALSLFLAREIRKEEQKKKAASPQPSSDDQAKKGPVVEVSPSSKPRKAAAAKKRRARPESRSVLLGVGGIPGREAPGPFAPLRHPAPLTFDRGEPSAWGDIDALQKSESERGVDAIESIRQKVEFQRGVNGLVGGFTIFFLLQELQRKRKFRKHITI